MPRFPRSDPGQSQDWQHDKIQQLRRRRSGGNRVSSLSDDHPAAASGILEGLSVVASDLLTLPYPGFWTLTWSWLSATGVVQSSAARSIGRLTGTGSFDIRSGGSGWAHYAGVDPVPGVLDGTGTALLAVESAVLGVQVTAYDVTEDDADETEIQISAQYGGAA